MSKPLSGLGKGSVSSFSGYAVLAEMLLLYGPLLTASALPSTALQRCVLLPVCVLLGQVDITSAWRRVLAP